MTNADRKETRSKLSEPAVMMLIRRYGRYQKVYSGFDVLANCSGRNVAHFLETIGRVLDQAPRGKNGRIAVPIPAATQTSVVYEMSNRSWQAMQDYYTYGPHLAELIRRIAEEMRLLLLVPWLPRTSFAALEITKDPEEIIRNAIEHKNADIVASGEVILGLVLRDGLGAGFLKSEPVTASDKNRTFRIWIDRTFLPILGLPFQSKQRAPAADLDALCAFFDTGSLPQPKANLIKDWSAAQKIFSTATERTGRRGQLSLFGQQ